MVDAKKARLADLTSYTRLEGLEPVPQEFHHRALMLQVNSYATLRKVANITNNVMQLFERLTVSWKTVILFIYFISFLFSKMETYSWIKQENTEQGEPGSYERLLKPLHAYSLSNLIQWKRSSTHKNIKFELNRYWIICGDLIWVLYYLIFRISQTINLNLLWFKIWFWELRITAERRLSLSLCRTRLTDYLLQKVSRTEERCRNWRMTFSTEV